MYKPHARPHIRTHTHTHALTHERTHARAHSHSLSLSLSHEHTHTHTHLGSTIYYLEGGWGGGRGDPFHNFPGLKLYNNIQMSEGKGTDQQEVIS